MERRSTLVPFAGWGNSSAVDSPIDRMLKKLGDNIVHRIEDVLGEELDGRLSRITQHTNEIGVDPFGFDPAYARYVLALATIFHRGYFRSEVTGIEKIPSGRCLVIGNHSGQIPIDAMMVAASLMMDAEPPRFPRSMVEKWSATLPFVSTIFPRCGQVIGSPENARRLLDNEELIVVFPEGSRGIAKTFDKRYQLTDFGLGFMRLALETKTPIVPVSVVGAEEQLINIANIAPLAKLLGMPSFPVMPQLFMGLPFPLPTKYHITYGDPIRFTGDPDDDDAVIEEKVWVVKATIQSMLNKGLKERKSLFF